MNTLEKKEGIDLIKKAIDVGIDTAIEIHDGIKSEKKKAAIAVGLIDNLYDVGKLAINGGAFIEQCKDIDSEEAQELLQHIVDKGIIPDKAEQVLLHVVALVEIEIAAYNDHVKPIIEIFKGE